LDGVAFLIMYDDIELNEPCCRPNHGGRLSGGWLRSLGLWKKKRCTLGQSKPQNGYAKCFRHGYLEKMYNFKNSTRTRHSQSIPANLMRRFLAGII